MNHMCIEVTGATGGYLNGFNAVLANSLGIIFCFKITFDNGDLNIFI